jgi:cathepsin D
MDPVSGLLGLAFQTIASSRAMPLWQTLVSGGAWDSPVMGFHLTRLVDTGVMRLVFFFADFFFFFNNVSYINSTSSKSEEPGGSFSMGKINFIFISISFT